MPVYEVNPSQMAKSVAALQRLASKEWLPELAMQVSVGGMKFVADEFNTSTDPYGKPWAPLKKPRPRDARAARRKRAQAARAGREAVIRGPKVLVDTGRMKASVGASPSGRTAKVVISTWYASVHQDGAHIAPHTRIGVAHYKRARVRKAGSRAIAGFHNVTYGNGITIPQRMMLPDDRRGLPATWDKMIRETAENLLAKRFGS